MPPQHQITEEGLRSRAVRITCEEPDEEFTYDGATAELKFAAAFVDRTDERKPIVLVISDQKLPVEIWIRKGFLLLPSNSEFPSTDPRPFFLLPFNSLARRHVTPKFKRRRKPRAKAANFHCRRISRCAQMDFSGKLPCDAGCDKLAKTLIDRQSHR
jgi:hypothetical protein